MRACWPKWVGRDWSISADYIWLNFSDTNTAMRCVAEAQIVPLESVFWLANLATGVFCGATIFAATFAVLCATFFTAKRRRAKLEAELDSSDDI